jgi:ABC-type arginine transport system permease subunit
VTPILPECIDILLGYFVIGQFLTDDTAQNGFKGFAFLGFDILSQGVIDKGLVIAATSRFYLIAKPINDVGIEADGNAGFCDWCRINRAACSF